jgi:hypothetical protein
MPANLYIDSRNQKEYLSPPNQKPRPLTWALLGFLVSVLYLWSSACKSIKMFHVSKA